MKMLYRKPHTHTHTQKSIHSYGLSRLLSIDME